MRTAPVLRAPAVAVDGKFLNVHGRRFLLRGVSYGTFAPDADGALFPPQERIAQDFRAMAALGANTVRTYTPPPLHLLDEADRCGLRVMVGLPWSQHTAFLDSRVTTAEIRTRIGRELGRLASHPAALLFAVGNEIPPGVIRWYGRRRIETFLRELFDEAKAASPDALLTYVNYPPTDYLDTSCFDLCAFNVFLHGEEQLRAYLPRLHHAAGARPLLVSEAGADSLRNGEPQQAALVEMQVRTAFSEGACGAVVFSWTDEWWRGGRDVDDWRFGLVDADRRPKLASRAVERVFAEAPFADDERKQWPSVSVIVCAYNAEATIDECLTSIEALDYPSFEVIVVNDGSTDATGAIAARHPGVHLIDVTNSGLGRARNIGLEHATGDIVAYTDADVRVDPDWLTHLVQPFIHSDVAAAGGPNVVPVDDPWLAQSVARAPGCPTHVLVDDRIAEHIPGCNCAFRREALLAIGGFDPAFVRAGDDIDVCWRLQGRGWTIGFASSALVWHHHRASVRAYLRQQVGYGEGETWLLRRHPDKFTRGRIAWRGHIYSPLPFIRSFSETRVNAGPFGSASFPSIYHADVHPFAHLPHSGRWQITWIVLLVLGALAASAHRPYAVALWAPALIAFGTTAAKCLLFGLRSDVARLPAIEHFSSRGSRAVYRLTIAWLHFLQPFARLYGRVRGYVSDSARVAVRAGFPDASSRASLTRGALARTMPLLTGREIEESFWSENWIDVGTVLSRLADRVQRQHVLRQVELDSGWWENRDLSIVDRGWSRLDVRALVEDHGGGRCLCRVRTRARLRAAIVPLAAGAGLATVLQQAGLIGWPLGAVTAAALAAVFAAANLVRSSSLLTDAVDEVATDCGMAPIRPGEREALRVAPLHFAVGTTGRLPEQPNAAAAEWKPVG
ncbi:MAG TPA: glycosyltransferase [Vicinamibacterales bacterium]|nr:glycosyltransferase [Vicinamibacterales bacterium]